VLSLTLNFLFIPWWQSLGSAISAFSVNLVIAAGQVIIFVKESDMGEDRGFYRRMILFFILSFVLFYIATLLAKSFLNCRINSRNCTTVDKQVVGSDAD
jgi:hypothetical protein